MTREIRTDPFLDTVVHIVADRQTRPNLPESGCPFCVGGLEAPRPYDVLAFANRWPALGVDCCEVVLYTPDHDASFASLGRDGIAKVIRLWQERTRALMELPDGEYVLIFENRGAEIGATISHPHGQIYAFDHVPKRQAQQLNAGWVPEPNPGNRLVLEEAQWRVWTDYASVYPVTLRIAPVSRISSITDLTASSVSELAEVLSSTFAGLEKLFSVPPPYMMWINQSPRRAADWPDAWLNFEVVSPWRSNGVQRYIAAAEVSTGEYFNPVDPADVASRLRSLIA